MKIVRSSSSSRVSGSALISTLLVITVLTIIVTAFLQSMTVERQTARSYLNRLRAELAADAAGNVATLQMADLFHEFPNSATSWSKLENTEGTTFYYYATAGSSGETGALPSETEAELYALPLASGGKAVPYQDLDSASAFEHGLEDQIDTTAQLNRNGEILNGGGSGIPAIRAEWIEILENPEAPRDLTFDPRTERARNGPIARYAYWIEDESFRVNVNVAGAEPRGTKSKGAGPEELDIQGLFTVAGTSLTGSKILQTRDELPREQFPFASEIAQTDGGSKGAFEKVCDYVTAFSSGLNFSRSGAKRLNLNEVVTDSMEPDDIRDELDRIIAAIDNDGAMPDFGQRFYQIGPKPNSLNRIDSVSEENSRIYLEKIAANIRDLIDTDSQPTVVNASDRSIRVGTKPQAAIGFNVVGGAAGPSDAIAVGKEAVPGLQEHAYRARLIRMNPYTKSGPVSEASFEFHFDHYLEFLNPTNEDILISDLGPNPFLRIYNQWDWDVGSGDINEVLPVEIPLESFVNGNDKPLTRFPAGKITVLTTDPTPSDIFCDDMSVVYRPTAEALAAIEPRRVFEGKTSATTGSYFTVRPVAGSAGGRAGTGSTDYDTHYLLGNDRGVLDSFTGIGLAEALTVNGKSDVRNNLTNFFRGTSLRGNIDNGNPNGSGSQTGDPRTINEQLWIQRYNQSMGEDQSRFFNASIGNNIAKNDKGKSSMGLFNHQYVRVSRWPDLAGNQPQIISDQFTAPGVIVNTKLDSIGQLGHVFDPTRDLRVPNEVLGARYSRSGGRTLAIGQSDAYRLVRLADPNRDQWPLGLWDGKEDSESRNRAAWRLADVFSTRGNDMIPGLVNINGILRDDGKALRAALNGLKFIDAPDGDSETQGKNVNVENLIAWLNTRFTGEPSDRPFIERGEISEIDLFEQGVGLTGVEMLTVNDRGREELFRRLIELITTKGNTFTVYAIGQALQADRNSNSTRELRVLSTVRKKFTFSLVPKFIPELPKDTEFDADTQGGVKDGERFRRPEQFDIQVLSESTYL